MTSSFCVSHMAFSDISSQDHSISHQHTTSNILTDLRQDSQDDPGSFSFTPRCFPPATIQALFPACILPSLPLLFLPPGASETKLLRGEWRDAPANLQVREQFAAFLHEHGGGSDPQRRRGRTGNTRDVSPGDRVPVKRKPIWHRLRPWSSGGFRKAKSCQGCL